jgi:hypothetical protein
VEDELERFQEVETVFLLGRRKAHRDLVRAELGEGLGHFRQAATHAADGVSAKVGPRVKVAQGYVGPAAVRARKGWESTMVTIAPMAMAALASARAFVRKATAAQAEPKSTKERRRKKSARGGRGPRLAGLLAAGTAVGAATAYALRRRSQPRWDEYDPGQALDAVRRDAESATPRDVPAAPPGSTAESAKRASRSTESGGITFTDTTSPTNRA